MNKEQIIIAAKEYMARTQLTQQEMAKKADMSPAYLSNMLAGNTMVGKTEISDKHWRRLAAGVGIMTGQEQWPMVKTIQVMRLSATIKLCRERRTAQTIIGPPGCGKTLTINAYKNAFPKHTYVIVMNSLMTVRDVHDELLQMLDLPVNGTKHGKFYAIVTKLRDIAMTGGDPLLIIDEAENIEGATLKLMKGMFDRLNEVVPIVLVGTDQLVRKMKNGKMSNKDAVPQFYRRFAPKMVLLDSIDRDFDAFFDELAIVDNGLKKLLRELCEDYGALNAYLKPVLHEAMEQGEPVSEALFREYHNLPALRRV